MFDVHGMFFPNLKAATLHFKGNTDATEYSFGD